MRYALHIAYDGTNYHGWQRQLGVMTVQEQIELTLSKIYGENIFVTGCGRTDTGVHALHYVLDFKTELPLPHHFIFRLNQLLPSDIAVMKYEEMDEKFNSRFAATARTYLYRTHFVKNPFLHGKSVFLFKKPNIELMNEACLYLLKHKDFASFCKSGAQNKTTLCNVTKAEWTEGAMGLDFEITADRFLRNMVRAIVGTLLKVGYGLISPLEFEQIILQKNRTAAGKSAAACGLYLKKINY